MTRENKKRLAILVMYIARIVGQSLRDVPLVLLIAGFLFLLFAPPTAWMAINQIWYHLRPLTDRDHVRKKCVWLTPACLAGCCQFSLHSFC